MHCVVASFITARGYTRSHHNGRAGRDNPSESDMLNTRSDNMSRHDCRRLMSYWWIIRVWGVVILTACRVAILQLGKLIISGVSG
ncbi:hypothetical protein KCU65_g95, partial [Aureobasidium melanogenum]